MGCAESMCSGCVRKHKAQHSSGNFLLSSFVVMHSFVYDSLALNLAEGPRRTPGARCDERLQLGTFSHLVDAGPRINWWTRRRAAPRRLRLRRRRGARGPTRSPPTPSGRRYTGFASTNYSSPGSRWRRRDRRLACQMDVEAVRYVLPLQRSRFFASKRGGIAKCSSSY